MQLLHPFLPFITEEIYHGLKDRKDDITVKQFPPNYHSDKSVLQNALLLKETITGIRDARNKNQVKPKEVIQLHIQSGNPAIYKPIEQILAKQINADAINYVTDAVPNTINVVIQKDKFYIQTAMELDTASQKEQLIKKTSII